MKAPGGAFRPAAPDHPAPGTTRTRRRENIFFDYDGDRKIHGITAEQLAMWQENFPAVDVPGELRKAAVWLDANRRNRKHDLKRFLAGWLTRARDDTANAGHNGSRDFELGVTVLDREFRWGENERG